MVTVDMTEWNNKYGREYEGYKWVVTCSRPGQKFPYRWGRASNDYGEIVAFMAEKMLTMDVMLTCTDSLDEHKQPSTICWFHWSRPDDWDEAECRRAHRIVYFLGENS